MCTIILAIVKIWTGSTPSRRVSNSCGPTKPLCSPGSSEAASRGATHSLFSGNHDATGLRLEVSQTHAQAQNRRRSRSASCCQHVEQRSGLLEVGGVKALGEPAIDLGE